MMAEHSEITVSVDLPSNEALVLALFVKRLGWQEVRKCAVDEAETYLIRAASNKLQNSLARAGFAPR